MLFSNIVVATDVTSYGELAIGYAISLAKKFQGTKVHCVHVVDVEALDYGALEYFIDSSDHTSDLRVSMRARAYDWFESSKSRFHENGIEPEFHVRVGRVSNELIRAAEQLRADLLIVATQGRSGEPSEILGSNCRRVLQSSRFPVLAVKDHERDFASFSSDGANASISKIMYPVDFSRSCNQAITTVWELCRQFDSSLYLLHVVDSTLLRDYTAPDSETDVISTLKSQCHKVLKRIGETIESRDTHCLVCEGDPRTVLVDQIRDLEIDLVVVPSSGRNSDPGNELGSVAQSLAKEASCPVLVVPVSETDTPSH